MKRLCTIIILLILYQVSVFAQELTQVNFSSDKWVKSGARVSEFLRRESLSGYAYLKDVNFQNGIIEVDIAVSGERSYPGIFFRIGGNGNYERIYVRPHRAGLYPDALQYTPVFNGIAGWQLYNGTGYTSSVSINKNEWVKLRFEISDNEARVFVGDAEKASLYVPELKHGNSQGLIGLLGPADGTAYFSNFKYAITDSLEFPKLNLEKKQEGVIKEWKLSKVFPLSEVNFEELPEKDDEQLEWSDIEVGKSGLVDIAEHISIIPRVASAVYAKTSIFSEDDKNYFLKFGYSDYISVFLNGKLIFNGNSAYRSRDPSFLGILGFFDEVILPLKTGENELVLIVGESFGGWGFACKNAKATFTLPNLVKQWETKDVFKMPETVILNKKNSELYVSNYDADKPGKLFGQQSIGRVDLEGNIIEKDWIKGLKNPAGMKLVGDKLYVLEAKNLLIIDIQTKDITTFQFNEAGRMNDIDVDDNGIVYITDSKNSQLLKFDGEEISIWLKDAEIEKPNGIAIDGTKMYFCNNGDHFIKTIDLNTKTIVNYAYVGEGTMDGIELDREKNVYFSMWEGNLYVITNTGNINKLLDTENVEKYCANFEYDSENTVFYIPDFNKGRIVSYLYKP